jgi:hypothetical protein
MKTIEEEFPPENAMWFSRPLLADAYTRLRARAAEMERALTRLAELDLTGTDDTLVRYIILPIQQAARDASARP